MLYNALLHYSEMRKKCVSDLPEDQDFTDFDPKDRQLLSKGLPQVRDCILAIYDDVSEYAQNSFDPIKATAILNKKGGIMQLNREAQSYLNSLFITLVRIVKDGWLEQDGITISVAKDFFKQKFQRSYKFRQTFLSHFETFCRIEYWEGGIASEWKRCDSVTFSFEESTLLFTLKKLIAYDASPLFFQYGNFRAFSYSGKKEDLGTFPLSVYHKVLGNQKYELLQSMHRLVKNTLGEIVKLPYTENPYQGYGAFNLIPRYDLQTKHYGYVNFIVRENSLTFSIHFDRKYFETLSGIFPQLSPKIQERIINLPQCSGADCSMSCKKSRTAVFHSSIYPEQVLTICFNSNIEVDIESPADVESLTPLLQHILNSMTTAP